MSSTTFHIVYDGSGFKDNEMNAKSLASSLLAIAEMFEEADKLLNGGRTKSEVNIKASFKTGSFRIDFVTMQNLLDTMKNLLISDTSNAIINGSALVALICTCIHTMKFLGTKSIYKIKVINDKNIRIYRDDKQYIEVEKRVLELYNNLKIRQNLHYAITTPLEKDGCDEFAIIYDDKIAEQVKKEEGEYFTAPTTEPTEVSSSEYEQVFSIISVIFKKDNKWRLFDGNNEINAIISDVDFLNGVENGKISFLKGDRLYCNIKITQLETAKGLKTEYEITKVKNHIKRPEQMTLVSKTN